MQAGLIGLAAASAALAASGAFGERRRARRRATHGVGFMPWPTIVVAATFAAVVLLALGLSPQ